VPTARRIQDTATATRCGNAVYARRRTPMPRRATTQNFSPAILEFDAAMRSGRFRQDGNPALECCLGNVVGRPDRRGNLYPAKQRPEQKINAAVALMMAVGRAMAEDTNEGDLTDFLRNPLIA
jgi:phage terminase large subunit-like protein